MLASSIARYAAAVLLVAVALLVSLLAYPIVRTLPSLLFLAVVVIVTWREGLGPALVATLLSGLAADYFFVPPLYTIELNEDHLARLLTFASVALFISWLNESLKRERSRAEQQTVEARRELFERTRVEQTLRESEAIARLQHEEIVSIYRSAPVGLCVLDPDLRIARCNERFAELIGTPGDSLHGRYLREVFPDLVPPGERLAKLLDRGEAIVKLEVSADPPAQPDVSRTWVQSWSPLPGRNGEVSGINVVVEDVTESRRIEQELRRASRMKDDFLSTLSHELRTPLNAILGWSQMLLNSAVPESAARRALEAINRAAHTQTVLVNDVLDLSRIVSGKMAIRHELVEIARIIEAAVHTVRAQAEAKGVRLTAATGCHARIHGDPDRLQQVVWNLLTNAIKFTPAGGEVTVEAEETAAAVEVRVRDSGPGMSVDFLPYLFEPFSQADSSAAREHGGLGLGLAIVKRVVEMHLGSVRAENLGPGRGAQFTVTLPTSQTRDVRRMPRQTAIVGRGRSDGQAAGSLAGLCILVVDDDQDSCELLECVLGQHGATVTTATSCEAALLALGRGRTDLLISDVAMPRVDGYELIRRVRALPEDKGGIPAIAVTAYGREQDRARALSEGYQEHACKPIVPADFVDLVAAVARARAPHSPT